MSVVSVDLSQIKDIVSSTAKAIRNMNSRGYCSLEKRDRFRNLVKKSRKKGTEKGNLDFLEEDEYKVMIRRIVKFIIICVEEDWKSVVEKELNKNEISTEIVLKLIDHLQHEYDMGMFVTKWIEIKNSNLKLRRRI